MRCREITVPAAGSGACSTISSSPWTICAKSIPVSGLRSHDPG